MGFGAIASTIGLDPSGTFVHVAAEVIRFIRFAPHTLV